MRRCGYRNPGGGPPYKDGARTPEGMRALDYQTGVGTYFLPVVFGAAGGGTVATVES